MAAPAPAAFEIFTTSDCPPRERLAGERGRKRKGERGKEITTCALTRSDFQSEKGSVCISRAKIKSDDNAAERRGTV